MNGKMIVILTRRCKTVLLSILLLLSAFTLPSAIAAPKNDPFGLGVPQMEVVIVRSTKPGCEPLCPEWISAEGTITSATPAKFTKIFKQLKKQKLPVVIRSPGGDISAAIAIGNMIRKRGLDVGVGVTKFEGCSALDKKCRLPVAQKGVYRGIAVDETAYCFSACPLILASGVNRVAGPATLVGVHQPISKRTERILKYQITYRMIKGKKHIISKKLISESRGKTFVKTGIDKRLRKELQAYLKTMGISESLIAEMEKAPPTSINVPGIVKNDELGLTTSRFTLLTLVGNSNCSPPKKAENCVALP
jgi:hypothetical protein